jgi:hypothetical protein
MGLILKVGKTYTDRYGYTHGEYYGTIDEITINRREKMFSFTVNLYRTKADVGKVVLETKSFMLTQDQFDLVASKTNLDSANIFDVAYAYVLSKLKDWEKSIDYD